MQEHQIQKQKSISTKLSKLEENMNEQNDSSSEIPIKKRISRLTFLLSSRMGSTGNKDSLIAAIVLLNHALMTAEFDESMALKIMNIAKRIARKS